MEHPPIVSLANFEERRAEIVSALMEAATTVGFFYISDHGISEELQAQQFKQSASFFKQSTDAKDKLAKSDWANSKVIGYDTTELPDSTVRESMMIPYDIPSSPFHAQMTWPQEKDVPGFKDTSLEYMHAMHPVAQKILSCFATGLGFPDDFFDKTTAVDSAENHTFMQIHHYPTTEGLTWDDALLRIPPHTDESIITLLNPGQGSVGLELAAGRDGKMAAGKANGFHETDNLTWMPVPPIPGAIVVNVGDPLQMWSEGTKHKIHSNYHRVRMPKPHEPQADRYSIGYFIWPMLEEKIQGKSGQVPAQTMKEYMVQKGKNFGYSSGIGLQDIEEYKKQSAFARGPPAVVEVAASA